MSRQVPWTKIILETFLDESGINQRVEMGDQKARILEGIIRTRCAGWTIPMQAEKFNISIETVNRYVRELKDLYDATQTNSIILPTRKNKTKWEIENEEKINDNN